MHAPPPTIEQIALFDEKELYIAFNKGDPFVSNSPWARFRSLSGSRSLLSILLLHLISFFEGVGGNVGLHILYNGLSEWGPILVHYIPSPC